MPPKKFAHCCSLPIPPFPITLPKDLVVFCTPDRAPIKFSIRRLLEPANLSPQFRSFEARLVFENSFDRIVRTGSATLHTFAQDSIDLFRGEKPEGITACWTGPMVCHRTKHRVEFARRTGCVGECSTSSTIDVFWKRFSRRHRAGIGRKVLLGRIPAVSSTGWPSLSARKGGRCGGATYCREATWEW